MADPEHLSDYEQFTRNCIYKALPFRRVQWERWVNTHRLRYQAMEQDIAASLGLNEEQRETLAEKVRLWL